MKPVKGVFWIVEGRLLAIPFDYAHPHGLAKSGDIYVHKKIWGYVRPKGCKKTYNYYPRGRVETKNNGSAVVYMNPNIGEDYIKDIMEIYRLSEYPSIKYDYSKHYKCYLDVGWKAEGRR